MPVAQLISARQPELGTDEKCGLVRPGKCLSQSARRCPTGSAQRSAGVHFAKRDRWCGMSSIPGVSQQSNSLIAYIQTLQSGNGCSCSCSSEAGASNGPDAAPAGSTGANSANATLLQQLQSAVQTVFQSQTSGTNSNPANLYQQIEQAVNTTLQQNGVSPPATTAATPAGAAAATGTSALAAGVHGRHHGGGHFHHHHSRGMNSNDAVSSSGSQPTTLAALLAQNNIDPQQFQSDLQQAVSSSSSGTPPLSQLFQSFPTGQALNALA